MSKNILKMIEEMNAQVAALKQQVRDNGKEGLKELAKEVFDGVEGLKKFVIVGYTPSFNDGEPCTHSSFYGFGNYQWTERYSKNGEYYLNSDELGEREDFEEFLELEEFSSYAETTDPTTPIVYANSGVKDADKAHHLIGKLDDVCEMLFDTNYAVYFTLNEDGSVDVEQDDYDCGY